MSDDPASSASTDTRPQGGGSSRNDIFNTSHASYFPPYSSASGPVPARPTAPSSTSPASSSTSPLQSNIPLSRVQLHQPEGNSNSPSPQTASGPMRANAATTRAMKGKLTTAMIQDKLCWICFTTESDADSAGKGRWVHPCKCALFSHESCLLAWIAENQARNTTQTVVACPQCSTPYTVKQSPSVALDVMESASKAWDRIAVRLTALGAGAGVASLSYFYGVSATRAFLGPQAFHQLLFRPRYDVFQSKHLFTMPLVAPALILSRTNLIDGLFPLLPLALLNLPPPSFYTGDYARMLRSVHVPGPATTCILLPFVRLFYIKARSWFYKAVLTRRFRLGHLTGSTAAASTGAGAHQARQPATPAPHTPAVQFEGQLPAQAPPPPAPAAAAAAAEEEEGHHHHEVDLERGAHLTLSFRRFAGMVIGALLLPYISAGAGELLLQASHSSACLRTILGVQAAPVWKSAMLDYVPLGTEYALDPAWWRNFLGGCLCVVTNDSFKLLRMYLQRRRLESRSIEEVDIDPTLDVKVVDPEAWRAATS